MAACFHAPGATALERYVTRHYPPYWLKVDLERKVEHARFITEAETAGRKLATVAPKFEGWIEKLFVDYTGSPVRKGQPARLLGGDGHDRPAPASLGHRHRRRRPQAT